MIVNLINEKEIFSLILPEKVEGQFWLNDRDEKDNLRALISIEALGNNWYAKSNEKVNILDHDAATIWECKLLPDSFWNLKIDNSEEKVVLFTEEIDQKRQMFSKFVLKEAAVITIGRSEENQICYHNPYVTSYHAKLFFDGENWSVSDLGSRNGTYVNNHRIQSAKLFPGDYIYIMGLRIVIGDCYFAINNLDFRVRIQSEELSEYKYPSLNPRVKISEYPENEVFFRAPRFHREIECEEVSIDPPPQAQKIDTVPIALMLGPSIIMAMASVSTGIFTLFNVLSSGGNFTQALPTLIMSLSMLLGTVLWPIFTRKHEKKEKIQNEVKRQEKYFAYLKETEDKFRDIAKIQTDILNKTYITLKECFERIIEVKPNLWERTVGQNDFLSIRLGTGTVKMNVDVKYQGKKFTMEDDSLQNAMLALAEEPKNLLNVPIHISLIDNIAVGIYGEKENCDDMIMSLILQLVSLHSYDEVKIIVITDRSEEAKWKFVRYLPHIWNNNRTIRYFAQTMDEVKELSAILEKEILDRKNISQTPKRVFLPYYICIVTSSALRKKCTVLPLLLKEEGLAFTAVMTGDNFNDFPQETRTIIHADGKDSKMFDKNDTSGKQVSFAADIVDRNVFEPMAVKIANIKLNIADKNYILPTMLTFLDMFHVGKVEHLNALKRWKENNPSKTLQTPIGVGEDGDVFMLDLHEKYHGPHGLVAGMTGSGKSELIITYILSLAVNYHPHEVAFILIDYKGGGLAGAFEDQDKGFKLPHLAGTITNLDGAEITRSLVSIQSELRRRQEIFNKARKISNEGTMDIYKYQQLYREKVVKDPVPHLFIISDEFAELKTQQPDFMQQLISAARIGRSLGIHLILATQKPSGVVDDQIWSNSRFRICLKVQEKADSQDMIKCPDAAEISQTGRFYLQVGFNELFVLGQSAWCGADYFPSDNMEKPTDSSVQVIDSLGRAIISVKSEKKIRNEKNAKQVVSIVKYLSDLAAEEKVSASTLWLPAIPAHIFVDKLEEKYSQRSAGTTLCPIVGEYDDPFNQKKDILTIPLSEEGNCLVFGTAGSGKTMFLTTLCYSLIRNHTPKEVNIYIMDYGSETLKVFQTAPQVGGIVTSSDKEKGSNLFKMLCKELERRRSLFSAFGGDYDTYCRNSGKTVPNIVVILNHISGFIEQMEDYQDEFIMLTRDGVKYGIYFVVTAVNSSEVRYKIQQNFKLLLTMQLNDETDYVTIVGKNDGIIPSKFKGRGLVALDRVYEFQTAYCTENKDVMAFIREFSEKLAIQYHETAKHIPILPETVNLEFVQHKIAGLSSIPVGVAKDNLNIVTCNLQKSVLLPVLSSDIIDTENFIEELISILAGCCNLIVIDEEKVLKGCETYLYNGSFQEAITEMFTEMVKRNNCYKDADKDLSVLREYDERCYLIYGAKKFLGQLDNDEKNKMDTLLMKAIPEYKIHFVLCDSVTQLKTFEYDSWYKLHIAGSNGIWIGNGVADQYTLKINKIKRSMYEEISTDFGYMIDRGRPTLMKLLSAKKEGESAYDA